MLSALIVHEGPSVFRIFNRWQAVNQKWKVLNYDKKRDSEELKASEGEWTLSLLHEQEQAAAGISPSTSSLMAAATALDTPNTTAAGLPTEDSTHNHSNDTTGTDHHCPYSFFHLLSHLRSHELRHQSGNTSNTSNTSSHQPRELVMRVTTVWAKMTRLIIVDLECQKAQRVNILMVLYEWKKSTIYVWHTGWNLDCVTVMTQFSAVLQIKKTRFICTFTIRLCLSVNLSHIYLHV